MFAAGRELVAPGKLGAVEPAARGELPFGLCRNVFAGPLGVGQRVGERHVHDRMIVQIIDVALRAVGMTPVGTFKKSPPLAPVAQIDRA